MKKKLTKNLDVRILSLVLGCLLWIIVMNISDPVETKTISDIPVTVINEDAIAEADKVYTIVSGNTVDITVKGPQSIVRKLTASSFTAIADLSKTSVVGAVIIDVKAPSQYEDKLTIVTGKRNDAVMIISLEDKKTSSFRVTVRQKEEEGSEGNLTETLENYYVKPGESKPNMVQITGAASVIDSIKEVVAEFEIKGRRYSFTDEVKPKIYTKYGYEIDTSTVELDVDKVEVAVNILPTKQVPVNVMTRGNAYVGYEVENVAREPKYITIAGEQEALNQYSIFIQYVDISGQKGDEETGILETEIDMNAVRGAELAENGVVIVGDDPKIAVKITFKKEGRQKVTIQPEEIELRNQPEGTRVVFKEEKVDLEIRGYMEDALLTAADLKPYIDLSDCTSGITYQLDVRIDPKSEDIKKTGICRVSVMLEDIVQEE